MNTSCDLMLLAAIAYKHGKYKDAGSLFAASLSAEDSESFLDFLNRTSQDKQQSLSSIKANLDISTALSESMLAYDDEFVLALSADTEDVTGVGPVDPETKTVPNNDDLSPERVGKPVATQFLTRPAITRELPPDNKAGRLAEKPLDEQDTYDLVEGDEYSDTLLGQKRLLGALIPAESELVKGPTPLREVTRSPVRVS